MGEYEQNSKRRPPPGDGEVPKPLFPLGETVATPGAIFVLVKADVNPIELILRHQTGDWGVLAEEDLKENERSLKQGLRLVSRFPLETGSTIWVITEWDRSVTTLLLPE